MEFGFYGTDLGSANDEKLVANADNSRVDVQRHRAYTVSQKRRDPNHDYKITLSILDRFAKILSLLQRAQNSQQKLYWVTHHTLSMLLHYVRKFKIGNFVLFMHVKHVSNVTLSSIQEMSVKCHENKCKD